METVTLIKDYKKRQFSPKAAKIAIDHFGWSETGTGAKPSEVGTKTKPLIIDKPVKLKDIPIEKKVEPNDDMAKQFIADVIAGESEVNDDLGATKEPIFKPLPAASDTEKISEPVKEKKTRKKAVKSKSK